MESRHIAINRYREDVSKSDYQDSKARDFLISGKVLVTGVGEALITVQFPILFTEEPVFTFGGAMQENQNITTGLIPTVSGVVIRYELTEVQPYRSFWVGADVGIVTTGVDGQRMNFNYEFLGRGLLNPVGQTITTEETI